MRVPTITVELLNESIHGRTYSAVQRTPPPITPVALLTWTPVPKSQLEC